MEEYSNEAHQIAVAAAIEFSKTLPVTDSQFDQYGSESEDSYAEVQNPTKAKTVSKDFLNALLDCLIIHWPTQMYNDPNLCFCLCSTQTKPWRETINVSVDDEDVCKSKNMTPN